MIQVSYVSQSKKPLSSEELLGLLLQFRANNEARGVTGMLLYCNGTFLQVIEGEDQVITELFERIQKDPRHESIQMLSRRSIENREYADWSMGFERVTDETLRKVKGLKDFSADDFNFDYLAGNEPVVAALMEHFREPNYDQLIGEINAQDKVIAHLKEALSQVRDRAQIARLALESLTQAAREGKPSESLVRMCETTIESLRPR